MKERRHYSVVLALTLLLMVIFFSSSQAFAEWINVHGNTGEALSKASATPWIGSFAHPDGMKFFQDKGTSNQVLFSIPSKSGEGWGAQFIKFRFRCSLGNPGSIASVDVYSGTTKLFTIPGPWAATDKWKEVELNLGSAKNFSKGLSISIKVTGAADKDSFYWFSGAGANFTQ